MTKHTPAPWKIERSGMYLTIQTNSWTMAEVFRSDYDSATVIQTQEANAKLIAAAPDLLEALIAMVAMVERELSLGKNVILDGGSVAYKARAAITKATGGIA
jgi:hypothetical protein